MKLKRYLYVLLVLLLSAVAAQAGIRCANDLISKGDTTFEVQLKLKQCGEVLGQEVIRKERIQGKGDVDIEVERRIELWHIRVQEQGGAYCYPLTFEEGTLKEIGSWKRCD